MSDFFDYHDLDILLVEDDDLARMSTQIVLSKLGNVDAAASANEAIQRISLKHYHLIFVDLDMEYECAGLNVVAHITNEYTHTIVLSGRDDQETIEKCYKYGAKDFLAKPVRFEQLEKAVLRFILEKKLYGLELGRDWKSYFFKDKFFTQDKALIDSLGDLPHLALSDRPIIIEGKTGTGKSLLAREIHSLRHPGDNKGLKFVSLNCAEISENLIESELFGHVKGSFTGAIENKKGKLELAHGGTLFLDEIGLMPLNCQQKLLKAIEERAFYPVGSEKKINTHFRLISATCDNLDQLIRDGKFRVDFYYRVHGKKLILPDLKDRKNDISLLIRNFLNKAPRRVIFSHELIKAMEDYHWPGNIRELEQEMFILLSKDQGLFDVQDWTPPAHNDAKTTSCPCVVDLNKAFDLKKYLADIEVKILNQCLEKNKFQVRKTLKDLNISSATFYKIHSRTAP